MSSCLTLIGVILAVVCSSIGIVYLANCLVFSGILMCHPTNMETIILDGFILALLFFLFIGYMSRK